MSSLSTGPYLVVRKMVLSLNFCVKRATLNYSGHIVLPVDTTLSEQKAEVG